MRLFQNRNSIIFNVIRFITLSLFCIGCANCFQIFCFCFCFSPDYPQFFLLLFTDKLLSNSSMTCIHIKGIYFIFFLCLCWAQYFFFVSYSGFRLKCANSYLISNGYTVWCIVAANCRYFNVRYIFYLFSFMFVLRIKISNRIMRFPICDVFSCVLYNNIEFFLWKYFKLSKYRWFFWVRSRCIEL